MSHVATIVIVWMLVTALACGDEPKAARWPTTPLLKAAPRAVMAHVMVSFRSKPFSGQWRGWNYSNKTVKHHPDKLDAGGKPDIASVYYPAIGPYDMTDPDAAEAHCQTAKLAGIDGFIFDLGFHNHPRSGKPSFQAEAMKVYVPMLARYGLKAVLCYEDKCHWIWNRHLKTRPKAVEAAYADLDAWMKLLEPVQYRIGRRPLVLTFSYAHQVEGKGRSRLSADELKAWLKRFPAGGRPVTATQWLMHEYRGVIDGWYDWTLMKRPKDKDAKLRGYGTLADIKELYAKRRRRNQKLMRDGVLRFHMTCVFPGFDDRGCWGWGDGPRRVGRADGKLYDWLWQQAVAEDIPIVQIATWNDWFEGTNVEPAVEFGTKYLEITRRYAAKLKRAEPSTADLRLPEWIYKIRTATADATILEKMKQASELIRAGKYAAAERIVKPIAAKLRVADAKYWNTDRSHRRRPTGT